MRDGERGAGVAVGDVRGVVERGRGGYGFDEIETGAGEGAGGRGIRRALQRGELREAHEGAKRKPIAGGIVFSSGVRGRLFVAVLPRREDGADVEGAEGARAEGAKRIKGGDDGVGILKDEATRGREREDGAKSAVEGLDLDAAGARKRLRGFEREGQRCGEWKVVGAGERDGGRAGGCEFLLRSVTDGRGAETTTGTVSVRPS